MTKFVIPPGFVEVQVTTCEHGSFCPTEEVRTLHDVEPYDSLPVAQGSPGRHGCVICAYARGYEKCKKDVLEKLFGKKG